MLNTPSNGQTPLQCICLPSLSSTLSVSDLDTDLVLKAIEPIWLSKAETASRVRQRIETVWDWARARKYVEGENPARLRGHLDKILAKTAKVKQVKASRSGAIQGDRKRS